MIGYKWIANGGHKACPRCAALHGKKLLFKDIHPDLMPEPPLHVNCRCTMKEITEITEKPRLVPASSEGGKPGKDKGPVPITTINHPEKFTWGVNLVWRENGRPAWGGGPGYGYNGGGYRTHGINTHGMTDEEIGKLPRQKPIDIMDEAYLRHDLAYLAARAKNKDKKELKRMAIEADRKLLNFLEQMLDDPDKWGRGKLSWDEKKYAIRYRFVAIYLFRTVVNYYDIQQSIENDLPISP